LNFATIEIVALQEISHFSTLLMYTKLMCLNTLLMYEVHLLEPTTLVFS